MLEGHQLHQGPSANDLTGLVKEMIVPRYRKLVSFLRDKGIRHIIVDSDGDIKSLIPLFLEGGVTCVLPMECNAGCDVAGLHSAYPRLQMFGGLSKQVIALGGQAMEEEVRGKIGRVGPTGGYIPAFDHSVHPDVSLQTYQEYLEVRRDACVNAARNFTGGGMNP